VEFTLVLHHIHSMVFLKPTVSSRPSVPPRGSHNASDSASGQHCKGLFTHSLTYLLKHKLKVVLLVVVVMVVLILIMTMVLVMIVVVRDSRK